jgi:hypothetical protein
MLIGVRRRSTRPEFHDLGLRAAVVFWIAGIAALPSSRLASVLSYGVSVSIADGFFGLSFVLTGLRVLRGRTPTLPLRAVVAFLAYAMLGALSAFAGSGGMNGVALSVGAFALVVLSIVTAILERESPRSREFLGRVTMLASGVVFILVAAGICLFFARHPTGLIGTYGDLPPSRWYARVRAGFDHPNLLASWCIVASTLVGWSNATDRPRLRRTIQVLLAATVLSTLSRSILGFVVAAAWRSRRRRQAILVTTVCAAAVVGSAFVNPRADGGESGRRQNFTSAAEVVRDRPLFGVGLGQLPARAFGLEYRAHLTPLDIAATQGIPSLVLLTAGLAMLWRARSRPTNLALWGGMAGLGVDALGQDIQHFRHVWLLIGLVVADAGRSSTTTELHGL